MEVYLNGVWGTICHWGWDLADSDVVCRQLGFSFALSDARLSSAFAEGDGSIHLEYVDCTGMEFSILDCHYDDETSCSHSTDVGVACTEWFETGKPSKWILLILIILLYFQ